MTSPDCVVNRSPARPRRTASSIVHRDIALIDRRRCELGISAFELIRRAGIAPSTWWALLKGQSQPASITLKRLSMALQGVSYSRPAPAVVAQLFRSVILIVAEKRGVPAEQVALLDFSSEKPNSPEWLAAARVRRLAMYIVTVEFLVENAELARAIHCSRQNIKQARDAVETWRDNDSELDGLIARVAALAGQRT